MTTPSFLTAFWFFLGGLGVRSFLEYLGHRILHQWMAIGKVHRNHMRPALGQGVVLEYWTTSSRCFR